jgi:hypothetical protein
MKAKHNYVVLPLLLAAVFILATCTNVNACVPPEIEILSPTNTTYSTDTIPLTFTIDKPTSWIGYSLDTQDNATICGNTTLTDLADGTHCIIVYANTTYGIIGASDTVCFSVDTTPPNITDVIQDPAKDNVYPEDEVKVNATITDNLSGVKQALLNYTNGNGTWIAIQMTNLEDNIWTATIPAFPAGTNVTYVITAEDNVGNAISTEEMGYTHQYPVIPEFTALATISLSIMATLAAVIVGKRKHSN